MSSNKKFARSSDIPMSHRHQDGDDAEEDDEELAEDFVPDDDDDEEDDSEFDENASASSSGGDEEAEREGNVLDGTLALDEDSNLHFQGDDFHLVSSEPVTWGVLNFSSWKSKCRASDENNFTIRMEGEFNVEIPWELKQRSPAAVNKSPPSSTLKPPPPSRGSMEASETQARLPSVTASVKRSHYRAFVVDVSVTDYTTTKSDPSLKRIDHENTRVPTNPDCLYHLQATDAEPSSSVPPLRFEGDYYPQDTGDPCRLLCKIVKPRMSHTKSHGKRLLREGKCDANDGKPSARPIHADPHVRENGHSTTGLQGGSSFAERAVADGAAAAPFAAASSPAAAAGYSLDDDSENEEDVDEDYDEDIDGDELLALQQEAAMSTAEVLRKRYRGGGSGGGGTAAAASDDEDDDEAKMSPVKRGRGNDDEDDYGF
jgi:hypothetical protein